jgi:hypothetical protein
MELDPMLTATEKSIHSARSRKGNDNLPPEVRALIDECGDLDADTDYQAKRKREEALRKKLKDKLGIGTHTGRRYVLLMSYGTPQQRRDTEALKAEMSEAFIVRYTRECPVRNMEFEAR